jgi:hypothetical protein
MPGQPGPYGQQGMPMPPQGGGGGKGKTIGIIVGALVVVAAVIGGVLMFTGDDGDGGGKGGGGKGGGSVADDGKKYKLTTPATVAGEFNKTPASGSGDTFNDDDIAKFEKFGVQNPKQVSAKYKTSGSGVDVKQLEFGGVYGDIANPEAVVNGALMMMAKEAKEDPNTNGGGKATLDGEPETVKPAGLGDDAVMKCQKVKFTPGSNNTSGMKGFTIPFCMWGDNSTIGFVVVADTAAVLSGTGTPVSEAGATTAKVRKDTRVEIK